LNCCVSGYEAVSSACPPVTDHNRHEPTTPDTFTSTQASMPTAPVENGADSQQSAPEGGMDKSGTHRRGFDPRSVDQDATVSTHSHKQQGELVCCWNNIVFKIMWQYKKWLMIILVFLLIYFNLKLSYSLKGLFRLC